MNMKEITAQSKEISVRSQTASVTLSNYDTVKKWLGKGSMRDMFFAALGEQNAPRFMQTILMAMQNPAQSGLMKCDPKTILRSAMVAACTKLSIDPNLSQSALIPYKDQCTFQIMRRGLQQLSLRTGTVGRLETARVYEGDIVSHNPFTGEFVYNVEPHERDVLVGYMGYIRLLTCFEKYVYMTVEELREWGMRYSKSYNSKDKYGNWSGMWRTSFDVMCDKTVGKRVVREGGIIDPYSSEPMTQLAMGMKFDGATPLGDDLLTLDSEAIYPDSQTAEGAAEVRVEEGKGASL